MAIPSSLPSPAAARQSIAAALARLPAEDVPAEAALGRVTAAPVLAAEPLPGFDNSAMDGFAVRAQDTPGSLRVVDEARAGHPAARALGPGEAIAVSTGAPLPAGADAVARREVTAGSGTGLEVREGVAAGRDVRRAGEEVGAGGRLLPAGARLGAADLGALVAAGVAAVGCVRRPRVAVIVTGDELRADGPGAIRDSNRTMLAALARARGAEVVHAAVAPDDEATIAAALSAALDAADLVVLSGGMSVGPHDHGRAALSAARVELHVAGLGVAPGRPAAFGVGPAGQAVAGLPGNPLSALVGFRLLAEPALDALAPGTSAGRDLVVPAAAAIPRRAHRTHAVPCRLDAAGAHPLERTGHGPTAALGADALALVPPGAGVLPPGERVEIAVL